MFNVFKRKIGVLFIYFVDFVAQCIIWIMDIREIVWPYLWGVFLYSFIIVHSKNLTYIILHLYFSSTYIMLNIWSVIRTFVKFLCMQDTHDIMCFRIGNTKHYFIYIFLNYVYRPPKMYFFTTWTLSLNGGSTDAFKKRFWSLIFHKLHRDALL